MSYRLNDYVPDPSWKLFGPEGKPEQQVDDSYSCTFLELQHDMTPQVDEEDYRVRDAKAWAREGYATKKWDRCDRCGERYWVNSPDCVNRKLHAAETGIKGK